SGWFAFLLPSYSMYKALKHRPVSEPELERWANYWAVVGAFVAFEYAAEWALSWVPFYWEVKTIFLLFLSLPQTQGASFIYTTYLEPYYRQHENSIDSGIQSAQTETVAFLQSRVTKLFEFVGSLLTKSQSNGPQANGQNAQPSNPLQGLWNAFGPTVMNTLNQSRPPAAPRASSTASSTSVETHGPVSGYNVDS
ncbi:TB2/DP1, HVA22 family-domain-containing protein, partial [Amylostereum chailletii]